MKQGYIIRTTCPICERTTFITRGGFVAHLKRAHGFIRAKIVQP